MNDWTAGYVADIGYIYGYYPELNPMRTRLALLNAGLVCPVFETACELGFGQGLSANIHAATSVTQWYGTDFNPAQAGFAQELAKVSGTNARLYDESFADFARRDDLPEFDYIGLHGIWSWISDENRKEIVAFIHRKLKVGGVVFISYNTLPGWAMFAPMRHVMTEHARIMGSVGQGTVNKVNAAIDFSEKLLATNPAYLRLHPKALDRVQSLKDKNRHYLAHEYFNRDWHPMYFSDTANWLHEAKLTYACSASLLDLVDVINFSAEQQKFLNEIPDREFRESIRDYMINQQFRCDYWVKGSRTLGRQQREESLFAQKIVLVNHRQDILLKVNAPTGSIILKDEIYNPVLDALADHVVTSLGEIERRVSEYGLDRAQLPEILLVLCALGHVALVQDETVIEQARAGSERLNLYLCEKAREAGEINYLASPVTGGGIAASRFQLLFLLAEKEGHSTASQRANFVAQILRSQGQRIVKEGKQLVTDAENLAELTEQALVFEQKFFPILRCLGIA